MNNKQPRILVADDDLTSRNLLVSILTQHSYAVEAVENGADAWRRLQEPNAPSIVLLDLIMPGLNGMEVLRNLRSIETEQPSYVIIITSQGEKTDIVAGLDAGANDYLSKPFDTRELRARVAVGRRMIELQQALVRSREELSYHASHDALTGLLNRRAVLKRLEDELQRHRRLRTALAVGMCDIDHFKQFNDTHGHLAGDDVLREVTQRMRSQLREHDTAGRIGGEEFLIIAPMKAGDDGLSVFDRLHEHVCSTPVETRAGALAVGVSIGVACAGKETSVDSLLEAADRALYTAKNTGRNQVIHDGGCPA